MLVNIHIALFSLSARTDRTAGAHDVYSEHSTVALDVDRRAASGRTFLLRDLSSALPSRALENLSESELISG